MSDSPLPQKEFEELMSRILSNELGCDDLGNQDGIVEASVTMDSVDGWASAGNELGRAHVDLALTDPNRNDRLLLTDMLGPGSFNEYAAYGYNTFGADFIPNWGTMDSGHRPSSAASLSSLNQEQSFSPNQSFTSESNSEVDGSPLQLFTDRLESNSTNHPNCSSAPPSSLLSSAFPSPAVHNASVHPSLAISQALPFTCTVCWKTYKTKNNLQRHRRDALHGPATPSPLFVHGSPASIASSSNSTPMIPLFPDKKLYDCPHPDCSRKGENGFHRKDNMVQHQRLVHNANLPKRERRKGDQKSGIVKR